MHNHILEEPLKHKRMDGGNLLEIFCYTISNGLSTSELMIGSLFLEKTCFNPSGNMHYISDQPLPLHHQFWCKCVFGSGGEGGREVLGLYLAHHPSQRCGWNIVVVFGGPPPPQKTPIWSSYTEALEKPGDSQKYRVRNSLIAGKEPTCQALLFYKCVDRFLAL